MVYGTALISLDRSLYDSSSDGASGPRDARYQYRYRTHPRYLPYRTSRRSYMVIGVVGNISKLEEVRLFNLFYFLAKLPHIEVKNQFVSDFSL